MSGPQASPSSSPHPSPPLRPPTPTPLDQPPAKKPRTESPLPTEPTAFSGPSFSTTSPPSTDTLIAPQPLIAAPLSTLSPSTSPPPSDPSDPPRHRHRHHRHRHHPHASHAVDAIDVEYVPVAGDDLDDDVTLMLDDLQRVEGEEEDELRALRQDQDIDIEELRRRMREDEDNGGGDEEDEDGDEEEDSDFSEEEEVDVNDLPRLKDLQVLQQEAIRQGLPVPTTLLAPESLNVPFPPKPRPPTPPPAVTAAPSPPPTPAVVTGGIEAEAGPEVPPAVAGVPSPVLIPVVATEAIDAAAPAEATPAVVQVESVEGAEEVRPALPPQREVVSPAVEAAEVADVAVEVEDATERELLLSAELGLSIAEMRALDREYDAAQRSEREEDQRRRERSGERERRRREARRHSEQSEDNGYISSSSSSSSSSPSSLSSSSSSSRSESSSSSSDVDEPLSPYSAAFYTPAHSFYPAKSSRLGPKYQVDRIPDVIPDPEERRAECERNLWAEGVLVAIVWEVEAPADSVYWQVLERRRRLQEEREKAAAAVSDEAAQPSAAPVAPAEAEVYQPAVRSQRSSAKRAREYIATVASSEIKQETRLREGTEAAAPIQVVTATITETVSVTVPS